MKVHCSNFAGECRTKPGAPGKTNFPVTKALEEVPTYLIDLKRAHEEG